MGQTQQLHQITTLAEAENGIAEAMVRGRIRTLHCLILDGVYGLTNGATAPRIW